MFLAWGPPLQMVAALYDGALRGGIAPPAVSCPSGNCTWPLTPSLAICGGCIETNYVNRFCFDPYECNNSTGYCVPQPDVFCNYTLPSGSVAMIYNFENYSAANGQSGFQVSPSPGAYYDATAGERVYIANFDLFGVPYDSYSYEEHLPLSGSECALWICVQTYNITVSGGKLQQTVVAKRNNANKTETLDNTAYNITFPPLADFADADQKATFTVDRSAYLAFGAYMNKTMTGWIGLNLGAQIFSSDLIQGIWNGTTTIDAWINNVAASLTGVVRTTNTSTRAGVQRDSVPIRRSYPLGLARPAGCAGCYIHATPARGDLQDSIQYYSCMERKSTDISVIWCR